MYLFFNKKKPFNSIRIIPGNYKSKTKTEEKYYKIRKYNRQLKAKS